VSEINSLFPGRSVASGRDPEAVNSKSGPRIIDRFAVSSGGGWVPEFYDSLNS
jgi:hypothetical protein